MKAYDPPMSDIEAGTPIGWQVIDPDGNIVASGPITELQAVADYGQELYHVEEEESDGGN